MGFDGEIRFNTRIDNSQVANDLKRVENDIRKNQDAISKNKNAKLPYVKQAEALNAELEEARKTLESLKSDLSAAENAMLPGASIEDYTRASADMPSLQTAVAAQEKEVAAIQKHWERAADKVRKYDTKIRQAISDLEQNKARAAELSAQMNSSGAKMTAAFESARKSAEKFKNQILRVGASMIMFRVFSAILQGIGTYMGKALKTNEEYTAQLARLKGALLTAFQPIYEFILPGLLVVLRILTAIMQVVANVVSFLSGKTAAQSAKNAKALNDEADAIGGVGSAAKKAEKSLASFDEINTLGSPDTDGGGGGSGAGASAVSPDFGEFDTAEYKAKVDELTVYMSGALLALGAILAFSGTNVPLGIGLMAAGAVGLVSVVKTNWKTMSKELKGAIGAVAAVLGAAALVLGAVLAFSGVRVGLGIALMAIGAASLATASAMDWNNIATTLRGPVGRVTAIACAALLALGLILAFSGVNLPLGIGLIAVGAAGLVTVGAMNWNAIQDKLKDVWDGIKRWFNSSVKPKLTLSYWKEKFSNIGEGLKQKIKDGVNSGIALFNRFISWINQKMKFSWGDFSILGEKVISAGSFQLFKLPPIPALAQGAVLPANKPFLAMVGDQKNGTNVEAPLETIKQALAEVMATQGAGDININFTGDLAGLARVLKPVIDKENKRVGGNLVTEVT